MKKNQFFFIYTKSHSIFTHLEQLISKDILILKLKLFILILCYN